MMYKSHHKISPLDNVEPLNPEVFVSEAEVLFIDLEHEFSIKIPKHYTIYTQSDTEVHSCSSAATAGLVSSRCCRHSVLRCTITCVQNI